MSKEELMVSLVVPTNGVIEWVFPVLDSIYQDEPDHGRFEVIVTDNGDNEEFQRQMESYCPQDTGEAVSESGRGVQACLRAADQVCQSPDEAFAGNG